jgi:hypothetical protein
VVSSGSVPAARASPPIPERSPAVHSWSAFPFGLVRHSPDLGRTGFRRLSDLDLTASAASTQVTSARRLS